MQPNNEQISAHYTQVDVLHPRMPSWLALLASVWQPWPRHLTIAHAHHVKLSMASEPSAGAFAVRAKAQCSSLLVLMFFQIFFCRLTCWRLCYPGHV
jgi:hypothetical protein